MNYLMRSALMVLAVLCAWGPPLVAQSGADRTYYNIETIPLPDDVKGETGALTFTPDGRLVAAFHGGGRVFRLDPENEEWTLFAEGLHEPLGLHAPSEREVVAMQRPELTRLIDADGDGFADRYRTITDDFGLSGNYHEFAFGPAVDDQGNFYISLNTASNGAGIWNELRGRFRETGRPGRMYACVPYRGWVLKVKPSGKTIPWALGFRSPNGIGMDDRGRLFVTDNQGDWLGTSHLYHVKKGRFYGHVSSLVWDPDFAGNPLLVDPRELNRMRTRPVVRFPHGRMANSPTEPIVDTTGGAFGPFDGQLIIGEMNRPRLIRVMLDRVAGHLQGACVPFLDGPELGIGNHRLAFGPNNNLWVGKTARRRGWAGARGIKRVSWTGRTPMDVHTISLTKDGFELIFTRPVNRSTAGDPSSYTCERYYYEYHRDYGSRMFDRSEVEVTSAEVFDNGRRIALTLDELKPGYIYEINVRGVRSTNGHPVLNPTLYYTLNYLVDGTTDTPQFN